MLKNIVLGLVLVLSLGGRVSYAETYLFGASACPPWKSIPDKPEKTAAMANACAKDLAAFVQAFQPLWDVPNRNVTQLLNADATGDGVANGLRALADRVSPEDRVVIYINVHGGVVDALYNGYSTRDEVYAWWTEKQPEDVARATSSGTWMTTRALRNLINGIVAKEIILIIDACHAAFGKEDFVNNVHNGIGGRGEDWNGREAVLFSAHANQIANFTPDNTRALFTDIFAKVLSAGDQATLSDAFEATRIKTHRQVRQNCAKDHTHKELVQGWSSYKLMCTQTPTSWDPFGLLDDIEVTANPNFGTR